MFNYSTSFDENNFQTDESKDLLVENFNKVKKYKENKIPVIDRFLVATSVFNISNINDYYQDELNHSSIIIYKRINKYISSKEAYNIASSSFDRYQRKLEKYINAEFQSLLNEDEK